MRKNRIFGLGLLAVALAGLAAAGTLRARPAAHEGHEHAEHFMKGAKACSACQLECASCFDHCVRMVADGKKEHAVTVRTCTDCGQTCALAATLSASKSPMAFPVCDACAKVCDDCAKACEKFSDDKHMAQCAKACRECAKACREMAKHAKH
jgi:hypothetical protein